MARDNANVAEQGHGESGSSRPGELRAECVAQDSGGTATAERRFTAAGSPGGAQASADSFDGAARSPAKGRKAKTASDAAAAGARASAVPEGLLLSTLRRVECSLAVQ
jgi:hypothetical protein